MKTDLLSKLYDSYSPGDLAILSDFDERERQLLMVFAAGIVLRRAAEPQYERREAHAVGTRE